MTKGFTLLEFILYMALAGIGIAVASIFMIDTLFTRAKVLAINEVLDNGRFIAERIRYDIYRADSILQPLPGATGSIITLAMPDTAYDSTYQVAGTTLTLEELGGAAQALTTNAIEVGSFSVTHSTNSNGFSAARIAFTLSFKNTGSIITVPIEEEFIISAHVRKAP
jgi:hypothetical protein